VNDFSAGLLYGRESSKRSVDLNAGFLLHFAQGDGEQIVLRLCLAFWDRPRSRVLLSPKRSAWMHEKNLHNAGTPPVK
jgi:hypothetical protein